MVAAESFGRRLTICPENWSGDCPSEGQSICVSGVCLTVVCADEQAWRFDVVAETVARSNFHSMEPGHRVNLEAAVTLNTPLSGHFVQGHVDGVGRIIQTHHERHERRLTIEPDVTRLPRGMTHLMEAIIPKGSVSVDGVSLTVAAVEKSSFEVALIPVTLQQTTLGDIQVGDKVNLETDILSKTVVHWLHTRSNQSPGVTQQTLDRAGFLKASREATKS